MKKIVGIDHDFGVGGDVQGKVGAQLGIEGSALIANVTVQASMPLEKVLVPVNQVIDSILDKVEQWIPGDQTAMAAALKTDAHAQLVKLLSETP